MRLNALMMTMIVNMERTILAISGISWIPKKPYKLVRRTLDLNTRIAAANNSPRNFLDGEIGSISSLAPIRKMMINEQRIY
jgi:hypothetical protein